MRAFRYGGTLRPWGQLNLRRLEVCDFGWRPDHGERFTFGTAAFHRQLTDFEVRQFDLQYLGEETCLHDA